MSTAYGVGGSHTRVLEAAGDPHDRRRRLPDGVTKFEKFQQCVFDEFGELEQVDRKCAVETFVKYGRQHGIDVITEVLDKGRSVSEVFAAIARGAASERVPRRMSGRERGRSTFGLG